MTLMSSSANLSGRTKALCPSTYSKKVLSGWWLNSYAVVYFFNDNVKYLLPVIYGRECFVYIIGIVSLASHLLFSRSSVQFNSRDIVESTNVLCLYRMRHSTFVSSRSSRKQVFWAWYLCAVNHRYVEAWWKQKLNRVSELGYQCFIQAHFGGKFPPKIRIPPPKNLRRGLLLCECNTCKLTECSKLTK